MSQVDFSSLSGRAVLVVNVASQCGFTDSHYRGLKRLHDILGYSNKLAVLGQLMGVQCLLCLKFKTEKILQHSSPAFPCNQFGGQEPGTAADIREVAFKRYGARFTVMEKVEVTGPGQHPVWKFLTGAGSVCIV